MTNLEIENLFLKYRESLLRALIYRGASKEAAEDSVQTVFCRLLENDKLRVDPSKIGEYLSTAAFRRWFNIQKTSYNKRLSPFEFESRGYVKLINVEEFENFSNNLPIDILVLKKEISFILSQAIDKLPPTQKNIISQRIYEDKLFREMSKDKTKKDTTKANYRHAIFNMKKIFKDSKITAQEILIES